MINLLKETIDALQEYGKTSSDVICVINKEFDKNNESYYGRIDWSDFAQAAEKITYDNGFGAVYISYYLKIIGNGWWMERSDYDGSELWEFKEIIDISNLPKIEAHLLND